MKPADPRWVWLVYGIVFVPIIGPALVVIGSSILYYRLRRHWPETAARLNWNAWIAVALHIVLRLVERHLVWR
jgi:hypothetical protein